LLAFPRNCEFTTNNRSWCIRCENFFGMFLSFLRTQCRQGKTSIEAGLTIQIDSYSTMHLFLIFLFLFPSLSFSLSFSLSLFLFLSIVYSATVLPPTVQYRSILLLVQLYIRFFSSMSSHPITHPAFFCLSFATAAKRRPRKQSCKALMFPPAVKHFNLFDALASDGTCVQAKLSNDAADRNSKWIFLKCRMRRLSTGASAVRNAQKRCRKVINHVPRLRDILRMQSGLSRGALHRSVLC